MIKAAEKLIKSLEEFHIECKSEVISEGDDTIECVSMGVRGESFPEVSIYVAFDPEQEFSANIYCPAVCKFDETKKLVMLQTVNAINTGYRGVKFIVMEDERVDAFISVFFTEDTAEELVFRSLTLMNQILDKAYPILMKALYSEP